MSVGAVPRPTPGSGAHAAGPAGAKGARALGTPVGFCCPFRRGAVSVSRGASARRKEHQMTRQRSFKRLVRSRMEKTGESYTAARAVLLAGEEEPQAAEQSWLATSDERIRERTGRGWEEWFDLLDDWGAA